MIINTNDSIIDSIQLLCNLFFSQKYIDVYEEAFKASNGIIMRKASSQFTLCVFDGVNFTYCSTKDEIMKFANEERINNHCLWFRLAYLHLFPVDIENGRPEIARNCFSLNQTFQQIERVFKPGFQKHYSLNGKKIILFVGDLLPIVCETTAMEQYTFIPPFLKNIALQTLTGMRNAFDSCRFGFFIMSKLASTFYNQQKFEDKLVPYYVSSTTGIVCFSDIEGNIQRIEGPHFCARSTYEQTSMMMRLFII